MRGRARAVTAAVFTSIALLATACGGGGGTTQQPGASQGTTGGDIIIRGCTPKNALIPGNTTEVCGGDPIDNMTARLVHYNVENAAPQLDIAQSVKTTDNQNFTVKIKPGYKFQDGTEVKAKNFVDAWNYVAYGPNGQANSYFWQPVAGFNDVQCTGGDCKANPTPKAKTMSGLKVVDDHTFTIKTTEPVSNLLVRLGYSAFAPLPDSFFKDPKAFEDHPIGAGPFQFVSKSTTEMVFSKFPDYSGAFKPSVDKVTYRIYADDSAAYADVVSNQLDFTNAIPPDQLVGEAYKSDLPDRTAIKEAGRETWIDFSPYDPQLKDNVPLRKAISRAIDRDLIAKQIFNGTVVPATGWVSPVVDGYKAGACGDSCKFDATAAKTAYDAAGGYKGTLTMLYNADGAGNKEYSVAVCNSIKNALKLDCVATPTVDFATFQRKIVDPSIRGMFRSGWQMDYPSIENFLSPIYGKGGGSNYTNYDSPVFAKLMKEAAAAKTPAEANGLYQQAEGQLAKDFTTAPLWYPSTVVAWSTNVTNVKVSAFGTIDLVDIKKT